MANKTKKRSSYRKAISVNDETHQLATKIAYDEGRTLEGVVRIALKTYQKISQGIVK